MLEAIGIAVAVGNMLGLFLAHQLHQKPARPAPMPKPSVAKMSPEEIAAEQARMRFKAQARLGIDSVKCYNFGFVGSRGVGKSSLINAIRGLYPDDPAAADTDVVECTAEIKSYKFTAPDDHIVLWDIPGAGTVKHPGDTYFMDKCLYALDYLVIMFSDSLNMDDVQIAKCCAEYSIPFSFVRSKADAALDSLVRKNLEINVAKQQLLDKTHATFRDNLLGMVNLEGCADEPKVVSERGFIGSKKEQKKYAMDEAKLMEHICNQAYKRRSG